MLGCKSRGKCTVSAIFSTTSLASMISELDVTLTDYALALETAVFAFLLFRERETQSPFRSAFVWFFASIGVAALVGGTVHGFFPDDASDGARMLWVVTLMILGATALILWRLGALLVFSPIGAERITSLAAVEFILYVLVVLFWRREFAIALGNYLPAALFFLVGLCLRFFKLRDRSALTGIVGLLLTFVAAAIQHLRISVDPRYFNHNAFYHLLQGIALLLIFFAARSLAKRKDNPPRGTI